jgi:hypothetical protein
MADLKRPKGDDYVPFFMSLLMDVERLTGLNMALDAREIERRVKNEGLSFLTKTLPAFYKHVLYCVEQDHFSPILGFKHQRSGPLPLFLGGLVCGLFADDGSLRLERESSYLGYIGQICTFMYKCEFPYTPEQESQRLSKFKEVESELPETLGRLSDKAETILMNAIELARLIFSDFAITEMPKHGPGAVADMAKAGEKYDFIFSERIEETFPFDEWFGTFRTTLESEWVSSVCTTGHADRCELCAQATLGGCVKSAFPDEKVDGGLLAVLEAIELEEHEKPLQDICPARGIFVNKDSRGPRYISCEPKEHMWLQQAVGRSLMRHFERCPYTRGHVNFSDQRVNGSLARRASSDRELATVDLEDASDRVSLAVVRALLPSNVVRLLEACRSNSAILPNGELLELKKFAPMGSACCFPIESIVFYMLSVACVCYLKGWDFLEASRDVYVYGDDIILPCYAYSTVLEVFPEFFLAINDKKSYTRGPFRESCGVDAIDGIDVSTVKLRKPVPRGKDDTSTLISWAETSNLLFYAGFWVTADLIAAYLRQFGPLPYVPYQSGIYGITGFSPVLQVEGRKLKWDRNIQRLRVKVRRLKALTSDWSKNVSPSASTLHTLVKGYSDWSIVGRDDVSTMISDRGEGRLTLHHTWASVF